MKTLLWALVLLVGFGTMLFSYWHDHRIAEPTPWTDAFMYVGRGEPAAEADAFDVTRARLRLLPMSDLMRGVTMGLAKSAPPQARSLRYALAEKVILLPDFRDAIVQRMLASGRLPAPGSAEVVAGARAVHTDRVTVGGRTLEVVGVLGRTAALLADAYVAPADFAHADLFDPADDEVQRAYILRMSREEVAEAGVRRRLAAAFPKAEFTPLKGMVRLDAGPFYLYLLGLALLLLGGSALLIRLYTYLAGAVSGRAFGAPLEVIRDWRRLFCVLHWVGFGTLILFAALVYHVPAVQTVMLNTTHQAIAADSGPLAMLGKAYLSGSVLRAAVVTLAINLFLGALASITVPSAILPGIGTFVAWLRAALIGMILAPTSVALSCVMLPHSLTVLVEMEAYFVASLFALMIPIYLFRKKEGPTVGRRYGRALLLNVKAYMVVAVLLIVAALYEAVEVILQIK